MDMVERAEEVFSTGSPRKLLQHLAPVLLGPQETTTGEGARPPPPAVGNPAKRVRALRSLAKAAVEVGDVAVEVHARVDLCTTLLQPPPGRRVFVFEWVRGGELCVCYVFVMLFCHVYCMY